LIHFYKSAENTVPWVVSCSHGDGNKVKETA